MKVITRDEFVAMATKWVEENKEAMKSSHGAQRPLIDGFIKQLFSDTRVKRIKTNRGGNLGYSSEYYEASTLHQYVKNISNFGGLHKKSRKEKPKQTEPAQPPVDDGSKPFSTEKRTGVQNFGDYIVNWDTNDVVTFLGEFGTYACSIERHKLITRAYSDEYEGKGDTQAEIAMNFDFPHQKAVAKYMRVHQQTKSMPGQSVLEIQEGLISEEEAIRENMQAKRRRIYKETKKQEWKQIQDDANKWNRFETQVLEPFLSNFGNRPSSIVPKNPFRIKTKNPFVAVMGISDWHYLKQCYGPNGESVYDKEIAERRIRLHVEDLIEEMLKLGSPKKIYLPVGGNDNLHIDGTHQSTTAGTSQAQATDGVYRIGIVPYVDLTCAIIETVAQVADLELQIFPGNHDENTALLMAAWIQRHYAKNKHINVNHTPHPRLYSQYGKNCLIWTHGHQTRRLKSKIHQIIMGEARLHGIDMNSTEHYLLFTGHDHVGSTSDLNGNVHHNVMPSLSGTDDFWHLGRGYVGRAQESAMYLIDQNEGQRHVIYTTKQ